MLLVECYFESILMLILLDEHLCVIELGPIMSFNAQLIMSNSVWKIDRWWLILGLFLFEFEE
jgi:hypothetical protein